MTCQHPFVLYVEGTKLHHIEKVSAPASSPAGIIGVTQQRDESSSDPSLKSDPSTPILAGHRQEITLCTTNSGLPVDVLSNTGHIQYTRSSRALRSAAACPGSVSESIPCADPPPPASQIYATSTSTNARLELSLVHCPNLVPRLGCFGSEPESSCIAHTVVFHR